MVPPCSTIRRTSVSALLMLGLATGSLWAEESSKAGYLSPPEVLAAAEESEHTYSIRALDDLADTSVDDFAAFFWPSKPVIPEFPWVETDADGGQRRGNSRRG